MPAEIIATSNSKPASCPIGAGSSGSRVGGGLAATSRQEAAKSAGVQGGGAECYLTEPERPSGSRIEPYAAARIDSDSQPHQAAAAMTAGITHLALEANITASTSANRMTASSPVRLTLISASVVPAISPTTPAVRPSRNRRMRG